MNNTNQRDSNFIEWFKNLFKKRIDIKKDDLGIYHYLWTCDTIHEDSHGLKYDIYAKIKAVEIYQDLIEVEMIDIKITDSVSTDIQNIIKNNFPKYVNPKYVEWQLKAL